jgi:hypothetical protein
MFQDWRIYIVGHDVHVVDIDLPGTMTSYNISRVPLTPGILFYSNVVGYSLSDKSTKQKTQHIKLKR